MPKTGIEPVREDKSRRILSPVRLPVPPRRHYWLYENGTYRARTCDPLLVRQVLSQLSYGPINNLERVKGIEPSQLAWKARTLPLSYTRIFNW